MNDIFVSLVLLENKKLIIQNVNDILKNGSLGKVLIPYCLKETALKIIQENI